MHLGRNLALLAIIVVGICVGGGWAPHRAAAAPTMASPGTSSMALFAGTTDGTILRTDSGTQWHTLQNLGNTITTLAASRDGRTLYAANYNALWRSGDAGAHWSIGSWGGFGTAGVNVLAINPSNPEVVYAGTSDGLYQTTNGGASWILLENGLPSDSMLSVAIDSHDPASVWVGSEYDGLYHSTDGGSTWSQVSDTVLSNDADVQAIALSPADSSVIYAGTTDSVYQSVDGGRTWIALGGDSFTEYSTSILALAVSPRQASRVYAATTGGVYVSSDGGDTWSEGNDDLFAETVYDVVADPQDPYEAYAATYQGVYRTTDGGVTWSDWTGGDLADSESVTALVLVPVQHYPSDPASPGCCGARYFSQTSHNLSGAFLAFWQRYGGVDVFGYPRTEPFMNGPYLAQYTDRFELELVGGRIIMVPLGVIITNKLYYFPRLAAFPSTATRHYFPGTGHSLSGRFLTYWQSHHGSILLGAPISEVTSEPNGDGTGRVYQVQWFQNGRLEYHPELAGTRYQVEIGLTGKQYLQLIGWLPLV